MKSPPILPWQRFSILSALSCGVLALGLALSGLPKSSAASGLQDEKDEHGATPVARQMALLDKLVPRRDWSIAPKNVDPVIWQSFLGEDEQLTEDRVALGRRLYFDKQLSRDGTVACSTCHDVARGFTDNRMVSEGIRGKLGRRNAPTVMNAALIEPQFLDGRSPTLAHQAMQPILNPIEMGQPHGKAVVEKLKKDKSYVDQFKKAYGRDLNYEDLGRAIAAFERTLIFLDAPFDDFLAGDTTAITGQARKGWDLFNGKARCVTCHPINASNPLGTDFKFHNVGVSARTQNFEKLAKDALVALAKDASEQELDRLALSTDMSELGRFMVTKNYSDIGSFRTPQLRNVVITAPYMHDGTLQTLWDVVDHYNKGGEAHKYLDGGIEPLALSEGEINQIVAFLFTLTDKRLSDRNDYVIDIQMARADESRPFRDNDLAHRKKFAFGKAK